MKGIFVFKEANTEQRLTTGSPAQPTQWKEPEKA